jgi:hypothetical protein
VTLANARGKYVAAARVRERTQTEFEEQCHGRSEKSQKPPSRSRATVPVRAMANLGAGGLVHRSPIGRRSRGRWTSLDAGDDHRARGWSCFGADSVRKGGLRSVALRDVHIDWGRWGGVVPPALERVRGCFCLAHVIRCMPKCLDREVGSPDLHGLHISGVHSRNSRVSHSG